MRVLEPKQQRKAPHRHGEGRAGGGRHASDPVRAMILCPVVRTTGGRGPSEAPTRSPQARLEEAVGLARAIDLDIRRQGIVTVSTPRPATLFGTGKVEELRGVVLAEAIELVVVDHALSPVQQRNLEREWGAKVLDRTGLILEIFGRRARSLEGRLQVELAHLTYQRSRLVRSWTHLERQRGGYGFLGGPGETQIEADRRVIGERIDTIRRELETVKRRRGLHRASRRRVPYPVVAVVGYTNAGKSTLFNRLTGAEVSAKDRLFETLDPTMRALSLPGGMRVILSDTVGFISDLPTSLIAAFRATLEEVIEADLILHVRDIVHDAHDVQRADVDAVLRELGVDPQDEATNLIEAWNKIDLLEPAERERIANAAQRSGGRAVAISAATGEGVDALLEAIRARLTASYQEIAVDLAPSQAALIGWLHRNCEVLERRDDGTGRLRFRLRVSPAEKDRLMRKLEAAVE